MGLLVLCSRLLICGLFAKSCLTICDPMVTYPARLLCPWDSPDKNTGVGCHFLLQDILPSHGWNQSLLHCQVDSYGWAIREAGSRPPLNANVRDLAGKPTSGFDGLGPRKSLSGTFHNLLFHLYYLCNANKWVSFSESFRFDFWSLTDFYGNLICTTYLCEFWPVILSLFHPGPFKRILMGMKSGRVIKW